MQKFTEAVKDIQIRRRALSESYYWTGSSACHACVQGIDEEVKDFEIRRHALFYTDAGARALYRQNVRQALLRRNSVNGRVYRDDPTIMAWGLLNEPRCEAWKVRGTGLHVHPVVALQVKCGLGLWSSLGRTCGLMRAHAAASCSISCAQRPLCLRLWF